MTEDDEGREQTMIDAPQRAAFLVAIGAGASREAAARHAGLDALVLDAFLASDPDLAAVVAAAEGQADVRNVATIARAAQHGDWHAASYLLDHRDRAPNRQYSAAERTEAVALGLAIGSVEAGKRLGISHRTISSWLSGERRGDEVQPVIIASRQQLAAKMQEVLTLAAEQVLAGLRDPRQRLGDRVRALEVALEAARLLGAESQGAESLTDDETAQLEDWLRVRAPEIEAAERELAALGPGSIASPDAILEGDDDNG
jgi:transposase-like protein